MNCERAVRDILLESSGELDRERRARLRAHVAGCAACRKYRAELMGITDLVHSESAPPAASRVTADTILTSLALRPRRSRWQRWWSDWLAHPAPAAAAAAVAAFLAGFAAAVVLAGLRAPPAAPGRPAAGVMVMDDWLDVQLDLLNDDAAAVAHDLDQASEPSEPPAEEPLVEIDLQIHAEA